MQAVVLLQLYNIIESNLTWILVSVPTQGNLTLLFSLANKIATTKTVDTSCKQ